MPCCQVPQPGENQGGCSGGSVQWKAGDGFETLGMEEVGDVSLQGSRKEGRRQMMASVVPVNIQS